MLLSGDTLYGTTSAGGSGGGGTVFALKTNSTGFTVLYNFGTNMNQDGYSPYAGLILSGNTLYGTTTGGSIGTGSTVGTVFALNTNGTGFRLLYNFTNSSDGADPWGQLILSGNTLYGTTRVGGSENSGTVFAINTDGTGFTTLHNFNSASDGWQLQAGLTLSGHTLYGTAYSGGSGNFGTVFSLSFTPQLAISPSGTNLILTWPTNVAGFDYSGYALQSITYLGPSAVWNTNSPVPVVVNGQNTVTNAVSGTQQFFRLSQ